MEKVFSQLMELDILGVLVGVFVILEALKLLTELISWICNKFGIESKFFNEKKKNKETLEEITQTLKTTTKNQKELFKQQQILCEKVGQISDSIRIMEENVKIHSDAIVNILYYTIGERCNYYIDTLHGIPSNEVEILGQLGSSYDSMNGNHGLKNKIDYCLSGKLQILPVNTDIEKQV